MYKLAKKHIVISPKPKRVDMKELKAILPVIFIAAAIIIIIALLMISHVGKTPGSISSSNASNETKLKQFSSYDELKSYLSNALNNSQNSNYYGMNRAETMNAGVQVPAAAPNVAGASKSSADNTVTAGGAGGSSASVYSHTNNQVTGVDEADIVKNDGKYIYTISGGNVVIVDAYPPDSMKIVSEINISNAENIFVNGDKLIVLGNSYQVIPYATGAVNAVRCLGCGNYNQEKTTVYIYNIKDRENPVLESNISFNGNYVDSRMIGNYVYAISSDYVTNNNPIPLYSVNGVDKEIPINNIYYSPYMDNSYVFTTIGAIDISSDEVNSQVYLTGSTSQVYVSQNNIYLANEKSFDYSDYNERLLKEVYLSIAPDSLKEKIQGIVDSDIHDYEKQNQVSKLIYDYSMSLKGSEKQDFDSKLQDNLNNFQVEITKESDKSIVHRISIDKMNIEYQTNGEVPGHILNQFSMDEYNNNLRVATTTGDNWQSQSSNNVYVLDSDLNIIGKLESIAPGETIYSARFMNGRAYLVTYKSIDPLFVIDLSNPQNPKVLGYLKTPGYSDYLHPYDENHVIGIGEDANESIDADKIHTPGAVYYTAIQGLKVSLYDVSDVSNPVEVGKVVIGERGTDSLALTDHKAFLFDKDKGIIVMPVTEDKLVNRTYGGGQSYEESQEVWQGAYVLNIDLNKGINVRGKITHDNPISNETYGPAANEPVGATRNDSNGNIWTKQSDGMWKIEQKDLHGQIIKDNNGVSYTGNLGLNNTTWGDSLIDEQPGGISYYPYFDYSNQIQRSLFMDDVLYTISQAKIKANDLNNLNEINKVDLGYSGNSGIYYSAGGGGIVVPMNAVE